MTENNVLITQNLINIASIIRGDSINLSTIEKINNGEIRLTIGVVHARKYTNSGNILTQVILKNRNSKIIALVDNPSVSIIELKCLNEKDDTNQKKYEPKNPESNIFSLLGKLDLIIDPREIFISNLSNFEEKFKEAEQYGSSIACVYSLTSGEILYLSILSNEIQHKQNVIQAQQSSSNLCGCHPADTQCIIDCLS